MSKKRGILGATGVFAAAPSVEIEADEENFLSFLQNLVEQKGFEPSTPTLRT
jgi:hypothetical protein